MTSPPPRTAPCPVTGLESPIVQEVSLRFIGSLWRWFGVEGLERLWGGVERLGLYASPAGLVFFHPMVAGDAAFYEALYRRIGGHRMLAKGVMERQEFRQAAAHVSPGDAVLDVGAGEGLFRRHLADAAYQGLDPFAPESAPPWVACESLEAHLGHREGFYDVACAFQVVEHVADPLGFVRDMARALKPGGRLILAAPKWPSPLSDIPNNPSNAPPHHLTGWSVPAFEALCREIGLEPLETAELAPSPHQARVLWLHRLLPFRTDPSRGDYFASNKTRLAGLLLADLMARPLAALFGLPRGAQPVDVFLAARKG